MKKMFLFGALFAAGLSLTACSSDNDVAENNGPRLDGSNEAYITLNLNTPTENGSTRAGETYTQDDGSSEEYAVNNGIIVFFENSTDNQATATFVSAYALTNLTQASKPSTDEVTTQWTSTLNITEAGFTKTYKYALVILNHQDYFTIASKVLSIGSTALTSSSTFEEVMRTPIPSPKMNNGTVINTNCQTTVGTKGILMTNAPLSLTTGSAAPTGVQYMTKITSDNIQSTEAAAQTHPVKIYVERATAKIQVVKGSVSSVTNGTYSGGGAIAINSIQWLPDNTASTFNCVREVTQADLNIVKTSGSTYRYTGAGAVYDSGGSLYRTTWAVDQTGYTSKLPLTGTGALINVGNTIPTTMLASDAIAYVPENTMDYNMMYQQNTTRVIVKAIMGDGSTDYYSSSLFGSNVIYTKTNMEAALVTYASGLTEAAGMVGTLSCALANGTGVATATFSSTDGSDASRITALNSKLASSTINFFDDGACYYKLQVKHYHPGADASDEVKEPVLTNGPEYNNVYAETSTGTQKADYLGLYGVVRNTWYVITITGIKNVGTPTVPEVPGDTPDDEVNSYISAKINVMRWAKRTYNTDL